MKNHIFVFGSNLAGRHGKGSALEAYQFYGAEHGVGAGRTGDSFAIPTKDEKLKVMPLDRIKFYVDNFIQYAKDNPELNFDIVAIGCGLSGYKPEQIKPMFKNAPSNCHLPEEFK